MPSISTILGLICGLGLFIAAVVAATNQYIIFWSLPSVLLVFGGTTAAAFISYDARDMFGAIVAIFAVFARDRNPERKFRDDIQAILDLAIVQRNEGRIALENNIPRDYRKNAFVNFGVDLIISNYKPLDVRMMLSDIMMTNFNRGFTHATILKTMASYAPAFGMVGTVIGLIIILSSFGGDITQLGQGLSLALITTLYGIMFANFLFNPTSEKTARRVDNRQYRERLLLEGFVMLSERKSTLAIQDKLNSFLQPQFRYKSQVSATAAPSG